jgi:hypothetical protein
VSSGTAVFLWALVLAPGATLVHECGHFVAARLVRRRVATVEIGSGYPVTSLPWFGARLFVHSRPFGGGRTYLAAGSRLSRPAASLFLLGGACANLAVGAPLALLAAGRHSPALTAAAIVNLIAVAANTVPLPTALTRKRPNDRLRLWRTWFAGPPVCIPESAGAIDFAIAGRHLASSTGAVEQARCCTCGRQRMCHRTAAPARAVPDRSFAVCAECTSRVQIAFPAWQPTATATESTTKRRIVRYV